METASNVIVKLTERDLQIIGPAFEAVARARQALATAEQQLAGMLILKCPSYLEDPAVQFDMGQMAFVRVQKAEEAAEVGEK